MERFIQLFRYNDAVIEFVRLLLIKFDFEAAGKQIKQMREEISKDVFLSKLTGKII
jgi:hypothetical protein